MRNRRLAFTIDLLGEATITEAEADHVQKQYLDLLAGLTREVNRWPEEPTIDRDDRGPIPRVNVSVKLSALYSQFDPIDPEGTSAGGVPAAAADPARWRSRPGRSSTSTWSSTRSRTRRSASSATS